MASPYLEPSRLLIQISLRPLQDLLFLRHRLRSTRRIHLRYPNSSENEFKNSYFVRTGISFVFCLRSLKKKLWTRVFSTVCSITRKSLCVCSCSLSHSWIPSTYSLASRIPFKMITIRVDELFWILLVSFVLKCDPKAHLLRIQFDFFPTKNVFLLKRNENYCVKWFVFEIDKVDMTLKNLYFLLKKFPPKSKFLWGKKSCTKNRRNSTIHMWVRKSSNFYSFVNVKIHQFIVDLTISVYT